MGDVYIPESAMAIMAHPDDIEFSCAGTTARWASAGARISYVLCTNGDVGIAEPGMTHEKAGEIREGEAREAARIAGVKEIVFLNERDCMLENTMALRRKLVREIRRFRPEVIICGDPTMLWGGDGDYINHPDHRAAGWAAVDAAFPAAGQPNLFEELEAEGLKASKVRKVFVVAWSEGSYFVNIDATIETKIAALKAHKSQVAELDADKLLREWAGGTAKGKEMQYAESFRVVTLENDAFWEKYKKENG